MAGFAEDLISQGWARLPLAPATPPHRNVLERRARCAELFTRMMLAEDPHELQVTPTGQYGFTADGNESTVGLSELRSHFVFNQSLPLDHPLASLAPLFYGDPDATASLGLDETFTATVLALQEDLDILTMAHLEEVEMSLGLAFGEITGRLALGERLLRLQWYPAVAGDALKTFIVEVDGRNTSIVGW